VACLLSCSRFNSRGVVHAALLTRVEHRLLTRFSTGARSSDEEKQGRQAELGRGLAVSAGPGRARARRWQPQATSVQRG